MSSISSSENANSQLVREAFFFPSRDISLETSETTDQGLFLHREGESTRNEPRTATMQRAREIYLASTAIASERPQNRADSYKESQQCMINSKFYFFIFCLLNLNQRFTAMVKWRVLIFSLSELIRTIITRSNWSSFTLLITCNKNVGSILRSSRFLHSISSTLATLLLLVIPFSFINWSLF